ncbi:MAG: magnesium transporter [Enterobacteriaceae bacterium]
MPVIKNSSQLLAQHRAQILNTLLHNKQLVQSILGQDDEEADDIKQELIKQTAEIKYLLLDQHAADLADLLESLPFDGREALWSLIEDSQRGKVLVEVSESVWDSLTEEMSDSELLSAIKTLDLDDQVYLAEYLPRNMIGKLLTSMEPAQRAQVREILRFERGQVGTIMDFELIPIRPDVTLATVHRFLRYVGTVPDSTDKLFVIDRQNKLLGELPLTRILLNPPTTLVSEVMDREPHTFFPEDKDEDAARAFERYNLISAPVIDNAGKLMGRLTVEEIIDVVYEETDADLRRMGGLSSDEDIFAPVLKAVRKRSAWLAINLCTAFAASRVIGLFEDTISHLVALATLMPIVAGIGGNTGNQTITMIVRALALQHIQTGNVSFLLVRELRVALINGTVWGGLLGVVTYLLYGNAAMGAVMTLAIILNLLVAALMGVIIPMTMTRMGRDPAVGSSVMITAITDTGGFFIFLGLATLLLL